MGIVADPSMGTFISISDHGTLKVAENHSGGIVEEVRPSGHSQWALKHLVNLHSRNCYAISAGNGQIYLYQRIASKFELIK